MNNAVARTAQLMAIAVLPLAVGLSGDDYTDPAAWPAPRNVNGAHHDFDNVDTADIAEAFASWEAACEHARQAAQSAESLDVTGTRSGEALSLRWILVHMIEEYARHDGHADLLHERVDGTGGE